MITRWLLNMMLFYVKESNIIAYSLKSFICHYGRSSQSGHYVAYVKSDNGWLSLDDEKVNACLICNAKKKMISNWKLLCTLFA